MRRLVDECRKSSFFFSSFPQSRDAIGHVPLRLSGSRAEKVFPFVDVGCTDSHVRWAEPGRAWNAHDCVDKIAMYVIQASCSDPGFSRHRLRLRLEFHQKHPRLRLQGYYTLKKKDPQHRFNFCDPPHGESRFSSGGILLPEVLSCQLLLPSFRILFHLSKSLWIIPYKHWEALLRTFSKWIVRDGVN